MQLYCRYSRDTCRWSQTTEQLCILKTPNVWKKQTSNIKNPAEEEKNLYQYNESKTVTLSCNPSFREVPDPGFFLNADLHSGSKDLQKELSMILAK